MKTTLLLSLFLSLVTVSFAQDEIAKAQVEKISNDYLRAVETGDVKTLEKLMSPAIVYIAANNYKMTREVVFEALRSDFRKWSLHNTVIEACQVFGDTAVTTGTEEVRTESGPRAGTSELRRFTNVWQRNGAAWVMISRDVTVVRTQTTKIEKMG